MAETGFSIDVSAEQQAFAQAITPSELSGSVQNIEQIKAVLPESLPLRPTQVETTDSPKAIYSQTTLDVSVKFDAETKYKELSDTINGIQEGMAQSQRNQNNTWIPNPSPKNNFEERPTTDPTNLIFINRRERFSRYPRWG